MNIKHNFISALALSLASFYPQLSNASVVASVDTAHFGVGPINTAPGSWFSGQGNLQSYDTSDNVAFGKSVTVSGTIGNGAIPIHQAANLTDGLYGNGSSWIDATSGGPAWFTVDLGALFNINSLIIGRDRTGNFVNERNPGTVIVETSLDNLSFDTLWNSVREITFSQAKQSLSLDFAPAAARYVRLTFGNNNAAIDEVQITAVPEPSSYVLALAGLVTMVVLNRRRQSRF